ncbi:MAG: YqaA family protein [Prevotellaceae bacterium]|nr:YqaA family protein [Prevotellaceae bacterium]
MDAINDFLINYGYAGMLVSAFLAGSILPLSSEIVMLALFAAGLDPWALVIYGTIGNALGSMLNYSIGMLGRIDWIEKYLHVRKKDLDRAQRFMAGHGAWMGFFAFLPGIGEAITLVLGLMRSNVTITVISIVIGKFLRYALLIFGVEFFV